MTEQPSVEQGQWLRRTIGGVEALVIKRPHVEDDRFYSIGNAALIDHIVADHTTAALVPGLLAALREITEHYVSLANSGDCGFWYPEDEPQIVAARAALAQAEAAQQGYAG